MSFSLDVSRFVEKANGNMDLVVQKVSLDLLTRVVRMTPVKSGRARGNWMVENGIIPEGERYDAKEGGKRAAAGSAIRAAAEKIAESRAGTTVFIANNVPYIVELEDGSSTQAPQGMLRTTLQSYRGIVEDAANEVNR